MERNMKISIMIVLAVCFGCATASAQQVHDPQTGKYYEVDGSRNVISGDREGDNINQQEGVNIHGEWDTAGNHYSPAGQGNKVRQDGTFMQKAAGGYIDTQTGQFIPSN